MHEIPVTFVLFGATGDLAQKKIMPALLALYAEKKIAEDSHIIAFSRREWIDADYRDFIRPSLGAPECAAHLDGFLSRISYVRGVFDDAKAYADVQKLIDASVTATGSNTLFFLAVQPEFYKPIVQGLASAHLNESEAKILIEKPFGKDATSAKALEDTLGTYFRPEQVVHIDHYLSKPAIQKFLVRRREDAAFEQSLQKEFVASIAVKLNETIDIQKRGEFYDATGTFKDVVENHELEMLAMLLAALPDDTKELPRARAKAIEQLDAESTKVLAKGQYEGFVQEKNVAPDSITETFVKLETKSLDPRWSGIPITLEAGKALSKKEAGITISYRDGSTIVIDTNEKEPKGRTQDAYEVAIEHVLTGDLSLFPAFDEINASWKWAESSMEELRTMGMVLYSKGTQPII